MTMSKMIGAAGLPLLLALLSSQALAQGHTLQFDQRRILSDAATSDEEQAYQGFTTFRDSVSDGLSVKLDQIGDVVMTVGWEDENTPDPNAISTVFELMPEVGADAFTDEQVSQFQELLKAGTVGTYVDMTQDEDNPAAYDVSVYQSYDQDQTQEYASLLPSFADGLGLSADQMDGLTVTVSPSQLIYDYDILPAAGEEFDEDDIDNLSSALESLYGTEFTSLTNDDTD